MVFGEVDGTWVGVAFAGIAMIGTAIGLIVNKTAERRAKRDELEYAAERVKLTTAVEELKNDRDECMKKHAEKDEKIDHLEERLDECLKDHQESQKDREKLWAAIREMKAGPV